MHGLKTPYQVLNLSSDAEPVVIEAAHKALIKKYHPDLWVGDPHAQARAASINEAFATLRDPAAKAECDRKMRAAHNSLHAPTVQIVSPRGRGRGRWWAGWVVALFLGVAQFLPWDLLGDAKVAKQVDRTASRPASAPVFDLAAAAAAANDEIMDAERGRTLPANMDLPTLTPVPTEQTAALSGAQTNFSVRTVRSTGRPRAQPRRVQRAQKRAAPPRKSTSEKEFLEREGYIY